VNHKPLKSLKIIIGWAPSSIGVYACLWKSRSCSALAFLP